MPWQARLRNHSRCAQGAKIKPVLLGRLTKDAQDDQTPAQALLALSSGKNGACPENKTEPARE